MSSDEGAKESIVKKQNWHYVTTVSAAKAREFFGKAGSVPVRRRDEGRGLPTFAVWAREEAPTTEEEPGASENPGTWVEEPTTSAPAPAPVVDVTEKGPCQLKRRREGPPSYDAATPALLRAPSRGSRC